MSSPAERLRRLRVCAVSYLNTVPLVWGMLHGEQQGRFDLEFLSPSECADKLESGGADIGIVPSSELLRLDLEVIPGAGIACQQAVRSILLVSKVAFADIRILAADMNSRTSVQLARVLLARNHGAEPCIIWARPDLTAMLRTADAALIIGDPALRLDVASLPYRVSDLGAEWTATTGLPMVFAVWAGQKECVTPELEAPFLASCRFGMSHLDEIVRAESRGRGFSEEFTRAYLRDNLCLELGEREYQGLELFLRYAGELGPA